MSSQLQVTGEAKIRDIQGPVVANSGVITALDGAASQYVRGDGTLADFPTSSGGGSSVSYYLNSSVSQGTIGGVAYRELSKDPIIGAGTDLAIVSNGYIASYITDANDPDVVLVPGGNFNCEFYFSVNNNTGNPFTYAELYKYDGTSFTLLGTSVGVPEYINQGTTIAPYYFAIPVATAALALTDRLAIRIYVNVDGRIVTLHTENGHLCQVVTTLSKGMVSLNNLTDQSQFLTTGTAGTNFTIASSGDTHTFNLPVASATNTGKLSSTDWSTFNGKVPYTGANANVDLGVNSLTSTGVTIAKSAGISTLTFPQGTNDPAFIQHEESTANTGIMRFSVGDDNDATDYFVFGNTSGTSNAYVERFKITSSGIVNLGTWQGTAIADAYIASAATWNAKQNAITLTTTGTSGAATFVGATLNIPQYQGLLTNPVTGTGTTNNLPKFTGASTIGDSAITDDGTTVTLVSRALSGVSALFSSSITSNLSLTVNRFSNGDYLALKIENRPITAGNNGVGFIAFFSNKADATSDTFTSGKIYGKFDSDSYNAARITLSTVTGNNIYQDVLTAKDTNVGIGTINPAQTLDLYTTSTTANGVGTAIQIQSAGTGANQGWVGVNKGTGNGLTFSVQNNSIIFNTDASTKFGGTEKFRISTDRSTFTHPLSILTNDNNFEFNVLLRNNNTGTQALTGLGLSDSSNVRKGQVLWIPSNYVTASLRNSFLVSSVTNVPLILCADATGADTPNIIFQSGATNKMLLNGTTGNLSIGNTNDTFKLDVSGTGRFTGALTGTSATFSGNVGIGTATSPAAELQVGKASDVTIAMSNSSSVTSGNRGSIAWYNSSVSTVANIKATAVTDNVGTQLEFYTRPAAGSLTQVFTLASTGAATFSSSVTAGASSTSNYGTINDVGIFNNVASGGTISNPAYYGGIRFTGGGLDWGAIRTIQTNPSASWFNRLAFFTQNGDGGAALTERMAITNSGNVLINATADVGFGAKLYVNGNIAASSGISGYGVVSTDGTYQTQIGVMGTDGYIQALKSSDASATNLRFYTGITEKMRITSTGSVGIGTSSPATSLMISKTLASNQTYLTLDNKTNSKYNWGIDWAVLDSTNVPVAAIRAIYPADNDISLGFYTYNGSGNVTERMRITSGGNLIVGGTTTSALERSVTTNGTNNSGIVLQTGAVNRGYLYTSGGSAVFLETVSGNIALVANSGSVNVSNLGTGLVYSSGGSLTSTNPSDERLKDNITDISWGLSDILKLRPVSYHWKDDKINQGVQFGFIAQEVQNVMPEAIKEFGDDVKYLGLEKDAIYATLVKAIQELEARIKQLENK